MTEHGQYRDWAGPYVLGALEADELRAYEQHLTACEQCRREIASFAPIPGLLARIEPPETIEMPAGVAAKYRAKIDTGVRRLERSRARWRMTAAVAALVAAVTLISVATLSAQRQEATSLTLISEEAVVGQIGLVQRPWGTQVVIQLENLPAADVYTAWATDEAGNRRPVASWGPTAARRAVVEGAAPLPPGAIEAIVITVDGDHEVVRAVPAGRA